jgi:hypothetical protein
MWLLADLDEAAPTPGASLRPDTAEQQQQQQPDDQDAQAAAAAAAAAAEAAEAASFFKRRDEEAPLEYAVRVFKRLFHDDIVRLLGMQVRVWPSILVHTTQCVHCACVQQLVSGLLVLTVRPLKLTPTLQTCNAICNTVTLCLTLCIFCVALCTLLQELWKSRSPPSPLDLESLLPDPAAAVSDAPTSGTASAARALCLNDQVWCAYSSSPRILPAKAAATARVNASSTRQHVHTLLLPLLLPTTAQHRRPLLIHTDRLSGRLKTTHGCSWQQLQSFSCSAGMSLALSYLTRMTPLQWTLWLLHPISEPHVTASLGRVRLQPRAWQATSSTPLQRRMRSCLGS